MDSANTPASALRWARYDGIYYAALLVNPEDTPVPLEPGTTFVYFLDGESGAVLPLSEVEPFDLSDATRTSVPEAAGGVAIAREMLQGLGAGAAEEPRATRKEKKSKDRKAAVARTPLGGGRDDDGSGGGGGGADVGQDLLLQDGGGSAAAARRKSKRDRSAVISDDDGEAASAGGDADSDDSDSLGFAADTADWGADDSGAELPIPVVERRYGRSSSSRGGAPGQASASDAAVAALISSGSPIASYMFQCKMMYKRKVDAAAAEGMLVNMQELDFILAVKARLNSMLQTTAFLNRELEILESYHASARGAGDGLMSDLPYGTGSDSVLMEMVASMSKEERDDAKRQLKAKIKELNESFSVEAIADTILCLVRPPPLRPERKRATVNYSFVDAAMYFVTRRTVPTAYRVLDQDLAGKYSKQVRLRQQTEVRDQGVARHGLTTSAPKVMEKWRRMREIAALPQHMDVQPVAANGFVSRRFSEVSARAERHALKHASQLLSSAAPSAREYVETLGRSGGSNVLLTNLSQSLHAGGSPGQGARQSGGSLLGTQGHFSQVRPSIPAYYNFNDFLARETIASAPGALLAASGSSQDLLFGHSQQDPLGTREYGRDGSRGSGLLDGPSQGSDAEGGNRERPLISPLHTNFDPRATFADNDDELEVAALAQRLAEKSTMYSVSIQMPSEESAWYSVAYTGGSGVSESHRSSALSSASYVEHAEGRSIAASTAQGKRTGPLVTSSASDIAGPHVGPLPKHAARGGRGVEGGENVRDRDEMEDAVSVSTVASIGPPVRPSVQDWRQTAKRAILKQLTLYLRGHRGKPKVINEAELASIGQKLLSRAVQSESEKRGVAMALQANNLAQPFTKEMESSLRLSVDHYIERRFLNPRPLPLAKPRSADRYEFGSVSQHSARRSDHRQVSNERSKPRHRDSVLSESEDNGFNHVPHDPSRPLYEHRHYSPTYDA